MGKAELEGEIRALALKLIRRNRIMTLATLRPDGWPQATTVAYASEGLTLFVGCDKGAQKVKNIRKCERVSLTIGRDRRDWNRIQGLSMAATARVLRNRSEIAHAVDLLCRRFPALEAMGPRERLATEMAVLEITPRIVSVLDYTKGFGHAEPADARGGSGK